MASILIVDCDPKLNALLAEVLRATGHDVLHAESARQGLKILTEKDLDLAIIEAHLPDAPGLDLIRELRSRGNDRIKLIFMASLDTFWREQDLYSGLMRDLRVNLILSKPFSVSEFMAQLEAILPSAEAGLAMDGQSGATEVLAMDPENLGSALSNLREEYSASLATELDLLQEMLVQARLSPEDVSVFSHARDAVGRIRERARSYGFGEVGWLAGVIEGHLDSLIKGGRTAGVEEVFERIQEAMTQATLSFQTTRVSGGWQAYSRGLPHKRFPIASILALDRDPECLLELEKYGRQHLVHVTIATTEAEAVKAVQVGWYDGVFICIPGLGDPSFFDLVEQMRAPPGGSDLPIACISEGRSIADRVAAAKAGCALFLEKPLNEAQFLDAVRQLVAMRRPEKQRILIVDANTTFAQQTVLLLEQEGMAAMSIHQADEIPEVLTRTVPDLVLMNMNLPTVSGFDLCRMIRSDPAWRDVYVLFLADYVRDDYRRDIRIACFQAGGDECLFKPVPREELLVRIKAPLARARRQRERSDRDDLTGLLNRGGLLNELGKRLAEFHRKSWPFSLALIDIDHYREVQNLLGTLTAERVLAGLGHLLSRRLRVEDVRGRWAGDLFVLTLVGVTPEMARTILSRVQDEFKEQVFEGDWKETFRVSFSAGIAGFPEDGETLDELVRAADQRLHMAKEGGRNQIRY